jgi:hypothetical protein
MVSSLERLLRHTTPASRRIEAMVAKPDAGFVATFGATNRDHTLPG